MRCVPPPGTTSRRAISPRSRVVRPGAVRPGAVRPGVARGAAAGAAVLTLLLGATPTTSAAAAPPSTTPGPAFASVDGFAGVDALGQNGTTGGAGGRVVTATTAAQFIDYISRDEPLVVQVGGTITLPTGTSDGMHQVASDKTVIGLGSDARLTGGGLNIGAAVDDKVTSPPRTPCTTSSSAIWRSTARPTI